jgi:PAS domain S-box-containing protein
MDSRNTKIQVGDLTHFRTRDSGLRALARLSQSAVHSKVLVPFLDEAVLAATTTVGAARGAILQWLPNDGKLLLRAGVGWEEGEVGLDDLLQVSIRTRDAAWGVLVIGSVPGGSVSEDDVDFLRSVANVVALCVERNEEIAPPREHEVLQTIFDHIPVMISFWDSNGRLQHVNREWEQTLGWTLREAREVDLFADLYPDPEMRKKTYEFMERCDREWGDFQLCVRDGRTIDTTWARFKLSTGSSIGFGLDITERKIAERALADTEARFAKVFQASPVALAITTVDDGRIIDVNDSWLTTFGYGREEVIGRTTSDLAITVGMRERAEVLQKVRTGGGLLRNLAMRIRTKSGRIRDVIVSAVTVALAGEEEVWLSSLLDVTDSKRAQQERDRILDREQLARAAAESVLARLRAIESITDNALQNLDLDELLRELLVRVRGAVNADFASVALIDQQRQDLYLRAVVGPPDDIHPLVRWKLGHGVTGKIAVDGQPRIVHDLAAVDLSHVVGLTPEQILALSRSLIGVPLQVGDKIVGVVSAAAPDPNQFTDDDLKLLLLVANRVAPAIEQGRLAETVRAGGERLKALSARLLTAQEEERRRLAIELHDDLGQVLTAVKINLESVGRKLDAQFASDLADAVATVDEAMERTRDLAFDLRPAVLDDFGLTSALRWYTRRFTRDTGIEVHISADEAPRLETALETACFRVAQEALTNVLRHAQARNVTVALHVVMGEAMLKISDDGVGFDVVAARERAAGGISLGLLGMEERVSSLGGDFEVRSVRGEGTQLSARFPRM